LLELGLARNVCKSRRISLGPDSKSLKVISSLCTTDRNVRLLLLFGESHFLERWLSFVGIPIKARERPGMYGEDKGLRLFSSVVAYVDQFQSRHFPFLAVLSAEQVGNFTDSAIPDSCSVFRARVPPDRAHSSSLVQTGRH